MRRSLLLLPICLMMGKALDAQAQTGQPTQSGASSDTVACVVQGERVVEIRAEYDPQSGDVTVGGRPMRDAHPATTPPYLSGAEWYVRDEMVVFERRRYVKYGVPRFVRPSLLTPVGEFRGIPLFAEDRQAAFRFVYALVNPACEFQPYWFAATVGEVRGR